MRKINKMDENILEFEERMQELEKGLKVEFVESMLNLQNLLTFYQLKMAEIYDDCPKIAQQNQVDLK